VSTNSFLRTNDRYSNSENDFGPKEDIRDSQLKSLLNILSETKKRKDLQFKLTVMAVASKKVSREVTGKVLNEFHYTRSNLKLPPENHEEKKMRTLLQFYSKSHFV
jgi:hypothetical protein